MADISEVGIAVHSDPVLTATERLNALAGVSALAGNAITDLGAKSNAAGAAVGAGAGKVGASRDELDKFVASAKVTANTASGLRRDIDMLWASMIKGEGLGASHINAMLGIANANTTASNAINETNSVLAEAGARWDKVQRSIDPAYASARRYKEVQEEVNRALAAGVLSAQEAAGVMSILDRQMDQTAISAAQAANQTRAMDTSVANLGYQFNDIGMMLAAGQNPFMLAIQQGSQVTQVLGPMGATGAANALKAAFMNIFTPFNLGIYAAIAGVGLLVNWLRSGEEEAENFEDAFESLSITIDDYTDAIERSQSPISMIASEWGIAEAQAAGYLDTLVRVQRAAVNTKIGGVLGQIGENVGEGGGSQYNAELTRLQAAEQFNMGNGTMAAIESLMAQAMEGMAPRLNVSDEIGANVALIDELVAAYDRVRDSAKSSVDVQIAALEALIPIQERAANADGTMSAVEEAGIGELISALQELYTVRQRERDAANAGAAVVRNNTQDVQELAKLENDLALAIGERDRATREGRNEEAMLAQDAIDNIREEISQHIEAKDRIAEMREEAEKMQTILDNVELDNEGQIQAELDRWLLSLTQAEENITNLGEADISQLEGAFSSFSGVLDTILTRLGLIRGEMDNVRSQGDIRNEYIMDRAAGNGSNEERIVREAIKLAERLNISAEAILTIIDVESGYDPNVRSARRPNGQTYEGLFQFGDPEAEQYFGGKDSAAGQTIEAQFAAFEQFLIERARNVGMTANGLTDQQLYATVQGGNPTALGVGDRAQGGIVDNVEEFVNGGAQWAASNKEAKAILEAYADVVTETTDREQTLADTVREGSSAAIEGRSALLEEANQVLEDTMTEAEELAVLEERLNSLVESGLLPRAAANAALEEARQGTESYKDQLAAVDKLLKDIETPAQNWERRLKEAKDLYDADAISAEAYAAAVRLINIEKAEATAGSILDILPDTNDEAVDAQRQKIEDLTDGIAGFANELGNAIANATSFADAMSAVGDVVEDTFRRMAASWISQGIETIIGSLAGSVSGQGGGGGGSGLLGMAASFVGNLMGGGGASTVPAGYADTAFTEIDALRGDVSMQSSMSSSMARTQPIDISINGARGNGEIMDMVSQGINVGLQEYSRGEPARVHTYVNDKRFKG